MPDFQVMASKNNFDRPKAEREYFDKPVAYMHQGFVFSPVHKRPIEMLQSRTTMRTASTGNGDSPGVRMGRSTLSSLGASVYQLKNPHILPVTTGLNDEQLSQSCLRRPRDMNKKAGESSLDYGQIPFLRSPLKKKAKSMNKRYNATFSSGFGYRNSPMV